MSWIYVGSVWWKTLLSEYHPDCIIYQEPKCFRCNKKYQQYNRWKAVRNWKKIYCPNCFTILDRKENIVTSIIRRETTGKLDP